MLASETQLAEWTKKDRKTVRSRLVDVPFITGKQAGKGHPDAKLYESHIALGVMYGVGAEYKKGIVTPQEAARQLTLARTKEIDLNMEVTRCKRIPLEDVEEHNGAVLQNVAGILKASVGKKFTEEQLQETFAELHRMGEILRDYGRKAHQPEEPEPEPENWTKDPMLE